MQPGARWNKVEVIAEVPLDLRGQHLMPFAIYAAHPANVARKRPFVDELRQRALRYFAVCQSVTNFAFFAASRSDGGTTMKASRRAGSNVFENVPTYTTRPVVSRV